MKIKKEIINKIKEKQKEKERIFELYNTASVVITKDEMHRLKKVLKNEDKEQKLRDWAMGLALQINNINAKQYKDDYNKRLSENIEKILKETNATIVYTLHFNEKCKFGCRRIEDFMKDYFVTYELFDKGEITPEDLLKQLKDDGVDIVFNYI